MVVLLNLRHLRVAQINVESNHLDALGDGLGHGVLEGFCQAQLNNNAIHTEVDGLFEHFPLSGSLLPCIEQAQVDA